MSKKDDEESNYEERKAIVTKYKNVEFAVILPETEKSSSIGGALDVLKGKIGLDGKKDAKRTVQATVVDDPRLPAGGPVPQKAWEDYWDTFLKDKPRMQDHIAKVVTNASGVKTLSSDVDLRASFSVFHPKGDALWHDRKECPHCGETTIISSNSTDCTFCGKKYSFTDLNTCARAFLFSKLV